MSHRSLIKERSFCGNAFSYRKKDPKPTRKPRQRIAQAKTRETVTSKKTKGSLTRQEEQNPQSLGSQFYFNFTGFPFPLGPIFRRPTIRTEVEKNRIWLFEQQQALAFSNVTTNIRMTVIRLNSGGLWIHAPIAPTQECVRLVEELGYPVEYIVLPTFAYEHKVFVGPFSRKFPSGRVFVAPRQWSWPIPLPPQAFGIFSEGTLEDSDNSTPWAEEIEQKVFSSSVGFGPYSEVAFFHKPTKTLIVTDAVVQIPGIPPKVIPNKALENSGRRVPFPINIVCKGNNDESLPAPQDPTELLQLGWMRMVLLILYFVPFDLLTPQDSFRAVADQLFVSPVVRTLVFTKASREEVRRWVDSICSSWDFKRIIPAHFDAPIPAGPADFRKAFTFLFDKVETASEKPSGGFFGQIFSKAKKEAAVQTEFPFNDMRGLRAIENTLQRVRVINTPEKE